MRPPKRAARLQSTRPGYLTTVGVTAGASAPKPLIAALVDAIADRFDATVVEDAGERETVTFKLPRALTD